MDAARSALRRVPSIEPLAGALLDRRERSETDMPQAIAYQVGAVGSPVAAISQVTMNCAKPPKITTPRL